MSKLKSGVSSYIKQSLGLSDTLKKTSRDGMFWILTLMQTVALVASNIAVSVFIPILGAKEFMIAGIDFQLAVTGGIFFFPITCITDDIQTEIYGRKNNLAMLVSFGTLWIIAGVFFLISKFTTDPSSSSIPDLWTAGLASTIAFLASSLINSEVLLFLKKRFPHNVIVRFVTSTAVGQFFDTLVFTYVAVWTGLFPDWRLGWALFPIEYIAKIFYEWILAKPVIIPLKNYIERNCE